MSHELVRSRNRYSVIGWKMNLVEIIQRMLLRCYFNRQFEVCRLYGSFVYNILSYSFGSVFYHYIYIYIYIWIVYFVLLSFNFVNYVFLLFVYVFLLSYSCIFIVMYVLFCIFCFTMLFRVLFVCSFVLYRVSIQSQLTKYISIKNTNIQI